VPSESQAQHNLMEAANHSEAVREKTGISKATAEDYVAADAGGHWTKLPKHVREQREQTWV
jgi:hypothetical protein